MLEIAADVICVVKVELQVVNLADFSGVADTPVSNSQKKVVNAR